MSKSNIKIRAAHRVIVDGTTYEQDDFLPEDIDAETLEQLKLSHAVYEQEMSHGEKSSPASAEAKPEEDEETEAPKRRTRKK
ncbi:hypothetical protein EPO34_03575 [Patescibacteria group bacterium]|nr:MAG: hypothetical protein EPO34_03575 [Patescibacteria group bacterium]